MINTDSIHNDSNVPRISRLNYLKSTQKDRDTDKDKEKDRTSEDNINSARNGKLHNSKVNDLNRKQKEADINMM